MTLYRLKGRDLICLTDYSKDEIEYIIKTGILLKQRYYSGERRLNLLEGRSVALIFEKPSTRTRVSFEVGSWQLGAKPLYLGWRDLQLGRGETIEDTGRVLSRYVDAIVARVKEHSKLEKLAEAADVPVINALSDLSHPCQALADYMTLLELKGRLKGLTMAFVGDGSDNVLHSLLIAGAKLGVNIRVATPRELQPDRRIMEIAVEEARLNGSEIVITEDPEEAVKGADAVYTDVWVSMGQEEQREWRIGILKPYQVTVDLMRKAKPDAVFMHCLPAHRGEEVVSEVIDGRWSVVWDEAENRLHVQKAVLSLLIR